MSFSMVHGFVFAFYDNHHRTTTEYVSELERPSSFGDICDIHFEYHQAYLLPQNSIFFQESSLNSLLFAKNDSYTFKTYLDFFKPPIC
jgi:hypothetical protein